MVIYTKHNDLPVKIVNNLTDDVLVNFVAAFKTNYKPKFGIPILWLVVHLLISFSNCGFQYPKSSLVN